MFTYTQAFLFWYFVGIVTYLSIKYHDYRTLTVGDLIDSLARGLFGFFLPLAVILMVVIDKMYSLYENNKNKKLF